MAPGFFSKLVNKPSPSPSPSPAPSQASKPSSPTRTRVVSGPAPNIIIDATDDEPPSDSSAPNFTIIPPSPSSMAASSLPNSSVDDVNAVKKSGPSISNVDSDLTPKPGHADTFFIPLSSSANSQSANSHSAKSRGRHATVASHASTPMNGTLSKSSSKNSLRIETPPQPSSILDDSVSKNIIVESPTSTSPPPVQTTFPSTANGPYFSSTLLVPRSVDSDTASIRSASSSKSKRLWNRSRSNSKSKPSKSPIRQQSALASAIAASGLAMAHPVAPVPDIPTQFQSRGSAPPLSRHTRQYSLEVPNVGKNRSRTSLNYQGSDYSGQDSGSDSDSDSDSDDVLDNLTADNIPVTGFAVASSKRNADFHELFPVIPEGDYLIEDYGCALQREILIQGRLYISENHICFHANIFGWITDLSIPMDEIISLDKKMTAFVIPNAIQVSTRATKYTFASFLSRDTTFDVIFNIWRLARPENFAVPSIRESFDTEDSNALAVNAVSKTPPKVTRCTCGKEGKHYNETALETVLPGTPEKIHNLMFASGFIKNFMATEQKLIDLQISDWAPADGSEEPDAKLLARNMSYIKPLNASIGPKQTKCELRDEVAHCDFDQYVSTLTTTRTPEVPSGNVFSVKTRTCITWASSASSRVVVTTQVEWTGRSFIKGIIERSCIDGQKTYHADLDSSMRVYIQGHLSEFIPEGMDAAEAEAAQTAEIAEIPLSTVKSPEEREHERNQRGLQWAYDTFKGASNVAKQSTETALELVRDAWDQSSSATIPWFIIAALVISNIWTLTAIGGREEIGRRKEARKVEEKEKWVQGIVTALWEELDAGRKNVGAGGAAVTSSSIITPVDWAKEISDIHKALDAVEDRVRNVRESLQSLD